MVSVLTGEDIRGGLKTVGLEPGMVAHTCNSSSWKLERGGLLKVVGHVVTREKYSLK